MTVHGVEAVGHLLQPKWQHRGEIPAVPMQASLLFYRKFFIAAEGCKKGAGSAAL